jgi:hypothetical protein
MVVVHSGTARALMFGRADGFALDGRVERFRVFSQ